MNENIYGHIMETPQKVIRVEVQSDTKNVDGEFLLLIKIFLKCHRYICSAQKKK